MEYSCILSRNILGKVKKPFTKHAQPLGLMRASRCLSDEAADNFCDEPYAHRYGEEKKLSDNEVCPRKYEVGIWQPPIESIGGGL